jgi:hypothetical protein
VGSAAAAAAVPAALLGTTCSAGSEATLLPARLVGLRGVLVALVVEDEAASILVIDA